MLIFNIPETGTENGKYDIKTLYEKYYADILRYAYSLTKNSYDAEEAAQEAWLVIVKQFGKLRLGNENSVKPLLLRIVKYKSIDIMRHRKVTDNYIIDDDVSDIEIGDSDYDSVLFAICRRETVENIYAAISGLRDIYRDVLCFYYLNQYSADEIAALIGVDVRTVRKRIERGRLMLIKKLTERGENCGK